jgi:lipoyl synthase
MKSPVDTTGDQPSPVPVPGMAKRRRLPPWLRLRLPTSESYAQTRELLKGLDLHTVCESAHCPNHWECWSRGTATFMIGGDRCTRACRFCAVTTAKPLPLDPYEPARVAEGVRRMQLKHVVITGVARDDLTDGGADHFGRTIEAIRTVNADLIIEVLVPDFGIKETAIDRVLSARPQVYNHNLETVRRLTPLVRSRATYDGSLRVLQCVKAKAGDSVYTKSGLMVGLGETVAEVHQTLHDLRAVGCDLLTLGQYLQPTPAHLPVVDYVPPDQFQQYAITARKMGFLHVAAHPRARSSYQADNFHPASADGQSGITGQQVNTADEQGHEQDHGQ